jgi:hypothetical protein
VGRQVLEHDFDFLSDLFVHDARPATTIERSAAATPPSACADAPAADASAAPSEAPSEDAGSVGECGDWQRVEWSEEAARALFDASFGELWEARKRRIRRVHQCNHATMQPCNIAI